MKLSTMLFLAAAGYGLWYGVVGGKRLDDDHVRDLYQQYWSAFDRGDGEAICDLFTNDVSGTFKSNSRSMKVRERIDKQVVCESLKEFQRSKAKLESDLGKEMHTNFEYTIHSIEIAPDRKSAKVDVQSEIRVGDEQRAYLDMRTKHTDVVVRNFGRAQFKSTDGVVSFFR